jgi:hypothetical protein
MIKRLVTDSPETLQSVVGNIKSFFSKTDSKGKPYKYTMKATTEKRKFVNPETKNIEEKDIEVLNITDIESKDQVTVKMIPLIKPGEMRFEIGGEGETTISAKIKDAIAGKGQWKDYKKDTLKTKLKENISKLKEESVFKIDPELAFKIYGILSTDFPEIGNEHTKSSFFYYLNNKL